MPDAAADHIHQYVVVMEISPLMVAWQDMRSLGRKECSAMARNSGPRGRDRCSMPSRIRTRHLSHTPSPPQDEASGCRLACTAWRMVSPMAQGMEVLKGRMVIVGMGRCEGATECEAEAAGGANV